MDILGEKRGVDVAVLSHIGLLCLLNTQMTTNSMETCWGVFFCCCCRCCFFSYIQVRGARMLTFGGILVVSGNWVKYELWVN